MTAELPIIKCERTVLRMPEPREAGSIAQYLERNRDHFADAGPAYPFDYFSPSYWELKLDLHIQDFYVGKAVRFFVYLKREETNAAAVPIGHVNLNEIVRNAAQFCYLGYCLDKDRQGQGYMQEALQGVVGYAFETLNMHRIMANYQPDNMRSGNVLKRLGFTIEGFARDYLYINGRWRDHVLTSLTNPSWDDTRA